MQHNYNNILLQLLDFIKYPNNKEKFVTEFELLNHGETLVNLMDRLPRDIQEKIKTDQIGPDGVKQYITEEEYLKEFINVSREELRKFIDEMSPLLTLKQKEHIVILISRNNQEDINIDPRT